MDAKIGSSSPMTANRDLIATALLAKTPWANAERRPLAGDASNRKYERLKRTDTGEPAVLMDAPTEKGEDVRPFIRAAQYLTDQGLSAPKIYAEDTDFGFLLLEDLGDGLFARVIEQQPDMEKPLYLAATDMLIHLMDAPLPDLDSYSPALMADLASLAFSKYAAGITGEPQDQIAKQFKLRFEALLAETTSGPRMVIQRDVHAENLLWLPDRDGVARVGLLDFQDAMLGHPAYDLVSLLQDVRRDVPAGVEFTMIDHFIKKTGLEDHTFRTAYAALGVQRNLRILGVFARLSLENGKPHYVDMIPKVWSHMIRDLEHPALAPVAQMITDYLPAPTPENLAKLKP